MAGKNGSRPLDDGKVVALILLKQARDDAEDAGCDVWQFAIRKAVLLGTGATESDLRWLLSRRLIDQASEITKRGDSQRKFSKVAGLNLPNDDAFILSYGGKAYIEQNHLATRPSASKPAATADQPAARARTCWDRQRHELTVDGKVAKRFLHKAEVQWSALDKFQADGWRGPVEIDPPGNPERDPSQRLRELVKDLNAGLDTSLIHFRKDCDGNRVTFDLLQPGLPDPSLLL